MFSRGTESGSNIPKWPMIIAVVVLVLIAIQMLRVNRPTPKASVDQAPTYTQPGPLVTGDISIPAGSFHSRKLDLSRRAKLVGTFQTGSVKRRVSVLVVKEREMDLWNSNSVYTPIVETGYVPGGKISPTLEPGSYFLVIDNRFNNEAMSVNVNFDIE